MVLTSNQKTQLNKDLLEYLSNNDYPKAAAVFAQESDLSLTDVDPEGKKMEIKWKSILSLQKKITTLEEKYASLEEEFAKVGAGKGGLNQVNGNIEDLYLPKIPAKYQMKGHKSTVTCLAFHPQFTQLASSSEDGTVKIWEFETGDF